MMPLHSCLGDRARFHLKKRKRKKRGERKSWSRQHRVWAGNLALHFPGVQGEIPALLAPIKTPLLFFGGKAMSLLSQPRLSHQDWSKPPIPDLSQQVSVLSRSGQHQNMRHSNYLLGNFTQIDQLSKPHFCDQKTRKESYLK